MPILTKKFIDNISELDSFKEKVYWDDKLSGFGLRVQRKSKSYILYYRNRSGQQRKMTIGKVNVLTPEQARDNARKYLFSLAQGEDPAQSKRMAKKEMTLNELCDWYLQEGVDNKKSRTISDDMGRLNNHVRPLLGKYIVKDLTRGDIEKFLHDVSSGIKVSKHVGEKRHGHFATGGKGVARRVLGLLGAILEFAVSRNVISLNPVRGIKRQADNKREEFLSLDEIYLLGEILSKDEFKTLFGKGINLIKLLILTGCRRNEIASLRWEYINWKEQYFDFPDTKTGKQKRIFGVGSLHLLQEIWQGQREGWVFPSEKTDGFYRGANRIFDKIRKVRDDKGDFVINPKITLHGLRHTFASVGASMGYSDFIIGGIIGHKQKTITSQYMHSVSKDLVRIADIISLKIEQALKGIKEESAKIIDISKIA